LRSRPADLSPGESGAVEPWRPAPLLVYAADRKQVCPAHGPILRGVDAAAMREIGDEQVPRHARAATSFHVRAYIGARHGFVTACVVDRLGEVAFVGVQDDGLWRTKSLTATDSVMSRVSVPSRTGPCSFP